MPAGPVAGRSFVFSDLEDEAENSRVRRSGRLSSPGDGGVHADSIVIAGSIVMRAAKPLTTPTPPLPPHARPPGEEGLFQNKSNSLPPLPGRADVRWERRAGEVRGFEGNAAYYLNVPLYARASFVRVHPLQ